MNAENKRMTKLGGAVGWPSCCRMEDEGGCWVEGRKGGSAKLEWQQQHPVAATQHQKRLPLHSTPMLAATPSLSQEFQQKCHRVLIKIGKPAISQTGLLKKHMIG